MVDTKFGDFQWDFSSQTGSTDRLGCSSSGESIGGTWPFQERKWHMNELELPAVKLALQILLKSQKFTSIHIQMDNIVTLTYLKKMVRNKESENDYTVKRDLGNINFKTDHDYCGVPTQLTQQSGGLGISTKSGPF